MKTCVCCLAELPLDAFNRQRRAKDGLQAYCRICSQAKQQAYYAANTERLRRRARERPYDALKNRDTRLRRQYGITAEEYDAMAAAQGGLCLICGLPPATGWGHTAPKLVIDHCHETGAVRGLLCSQCNVGLGKFLDRPALLRRAAEYLETQKAGAPGDTGQPSAI